MRPPGRRPQGHRTRSLGPGALGLVLLLACGPRTVTTPPAAAADPAGPTTHPPSPVRAPCGSPGEDFSDHAWTPPDAPAVASIRLDATDLSAALTALGDHVRTPGHGLPIPLALSLGQWSWQVPLVASTLDAAGFAPGELTFVASNDAAHAWVWRSTCDLDEILARIEAAWAVRTRRTTLAVIGTPAAPTPERPAFPYDVLVLPAERLALVPAGRGSAVLTRWTRLAPAPSLGGTVQTAGRRLDQLDPAPVRLVVQGLALVDAAATTAGDVHALRITAQGVVSADPAAPAAPPP